MRYFIAILLVFIVNKSMAQKSLYHEIRYSRFIYPIDSLITEKRDSETRLWEDMRKMHIIHDTANNKTIYKTYEVDGNTGEFYDEPNVQQEYRFDNNKKVFELLTYTTSYFDTTLSEKFEFYNGDLQTPDSTYHYKRDYGSGELELFRIYKYSKDNSVIEEFQFRWDNAYSEWDTNTSNKYDYSFDGDLLVQYVIYTGNNTSNGIFWKNANKFIYEYTYFGELEHSYNYKWNNVNSRWELIGEHTNEYNVEENIVLSKRINNDPQTGTYKERLKWEYTYDTVNKKIEQNTYQNSFGTYGPSVERTTYFYSVPDTSSESTSVHEMVNNEEIQIYPNPSEGQITMELKGFIHPIKIRVLNTAGQTIYSDSKIIHETHSFNLSGPGGIYFLEITSGSSRFYRKILLNNK
jgi:hypothetical protein